LYSDFGHISKLILPGNISKTDFARYQESNPKWGHIMQQTILPENFQIIDQILFRTRGGHFRLVLPASLIEALVVSKHYTVMGLHSSKSRIRRDILKKYYCHMPTLNNYLRNLTDSCIQCQFNATAPHPHIFKSMDIVRAPRTSWAVDLIPSLTPTKKGNTTIFLAVDTFTGYIQLKAMTSRKTSELIEAVKATIITPFGIPKYFRCDNEMGMANSAEFKKFMDPLKMFACGITIASSTPSKTKIPLLSVE
jgi:hypothetical protein